MKLAQDVGDFRGKLGDYIVGGEAGDFESCVLPGVGGVVKAVGVDGHADEACCGRSGEIADGERGSTGIGTIDEGEGQGMQETRGVIGAGGGEIARVFVEDGCGSEVGHAAGGVASELGAVVAAEGACPVAPLVWVVRWGVSHGPCGFGGGNGEGGGTEGGVRFENESVMECQRCAGLEDG